jgi:hypothetical protein
MAAFFGRMFKMGPVVFDHPTNMDLSSRDVDGKIELLDPRTKLEVRPAFLDNSPVNLKPDANPRQELARWMTNHPYFAEAAVNRMWGYFFARGIVDPVDDFRSTNPPTHPELLAALAREFREHGYDLRHLMKTIVLSRTYQTSNRPNDNNRNDRVNYSHSIPRALDAEVLLDAVVDVTGVPETFQTAVSDGGASSSTGARTGAPFPNAPGVPTLLRRSTCLPAPLMLSGWLPPVRVLPGCSMRAPRTKKSSRSSTSPRCAGFRLPRKPAS